MTDAIYVGSSLEVPCEGRYASVSDLVKLLQDETRVGLPVPHSWNEGMRDGGLETLSEFCFRRDTVETVLEYVGDYERAKKILEWVSDHSSVVIGNVPHPHEVAGTGVLDRYAENLAYLVMRSPLLSVEEAIDYYNGPVLLDDTDDGDAPLVDSLDNLSHDEVHVSRTVFSIEEILQSCVGGDADSFSPFSPLDDGA